ncbi:MAG: cyanophycin synthetase [Chloroflexota bacterium]|nr:cyanophycin synthetase [Chloroflexota bacterium]
MLELAPRLGATIIREPRFGIAAQVVFANGVRRSFRRWSLDLNPTASSELATDKDWSAYFMRSMGYPAAPGEVFYSDSLCAKLGSDRDLRAAVAYARSLGYPLFVKPNGRSQGRGVCKVFDRDELEQAAAVIFEIDPVLLMQPVQDGLDYRIVVLDDRVLCAYERRALSVVGDGTRSVAELLEDKQKHFESVDRHDTINADDPRISMHLRREGRTLAWVPPAGEEIALLDNANLSDGGSAREVTDELHASYAEVAVRLTRDMGLRFCGIDIMTGEPISSAPGRYVVIEINAWPGIEYFAASGPRERERVDELYLAVLTALSRR